MNVEQLMGYIVKSPKVPAVMFEIIRGLMEYQFHRCVAQNYVLPSVIGQYLSLFIDEMDIQTDQFNHATEPEEMKVRARTISNYASAIACLIDSGYRPMFPILKAELGMKVIAVVNHTDRINGLICQKGDTGQVVEYPYNGQYDDLINIRWDTSHDREDFPMRFDEIEFTPKDQPYEQPTR